MNRRYLISWCWCWCILLKLKLLQGNGCPLLCLISLPFLLTLCCLFVYLNLTSLFSLLSYLFSLSSPLFPLFPLFSLLYLQVGMKPINSPSRLVALQLANGNALFRSAQLLTNVHVHVLVHAFNVLREGGRESRTGGTVTAYHIIILVHVCMYCNTILCNHLVLFWLPFFPPSSWWWMKRKGEWEGRFQSLAPTVCLLQFLNNFVLHFTLHALYLTFFLTFSFL